MNNVHNYFSAICDKKLTAPLTVQFEIHNLCVAKCITCKYREQGISNNGTTWSDIITAINDLSLNGTKAIRLTGGEPIIAPGFEEIVDCCLKNKLATSITTTLLTKKVERIEKLKKLKIKLSLSSIGNEYSNFTQIDSKYFNIVKNNLDLLQKNKKRVSINYTIFEKNYSINSLRQFIDFINPYNPFYVTFFPALNYENIKDNTVQEEIISNLKKCKTLMKFRSNANTVAKHFQRRKDRKIIICHINKFHAHIKRNGDVYPCCMSGGEIGQTLQDYFKLGNIFTERIKDIYERHYNKFDKVNLKDNPICKECTQRYLSLNTDFEGFLHGSKLADI